MSRLAPPVLAFLCFSLAGCSGGDPNICQVSGTLTYKGKPIPGIYLRFEPDNFDTKATSMAITEANGHFEMLMGSTPGVYKGKIKVFCDDPLAAMGAKTEIAADIEPAYRELCAKYGAGKSTHEITIEESNSNLELKLE
jgi:hypothetical protein